MTTGTSESRYMQRAIELAMRGRGSAEPNPLVGCVIVRDGIVVAEGYHARYGQAHAERAALSNAVAPVHGATAYVTLEPCCHTNKQTPPCVPALIEAGIARVVVGTTDPNPNVNGKGIAQLRAAGVAVDVGMMEGECRQLLAPFVARIAFHRPYITAKWAQTADDKVAGPDGQPIAITESAANAMTHRLRARSDAILIGIGTALKDNPSLTIRHVAQTHPLLRIVLDSHLRLPVTSRLVKTISNEYPLLVVCNSSADQQRLATLKSSGVQILPTNPHQSIAPLLAHLNQLRHTHLMIEPGPTLARWLLEQDLLDRLWVFRSPQTQPDPAAPRAATIPAHHIATATRAFPPDELTEYLNSRSRTFACACASADSVGSRQ